METVRQEENADGIKHSAALRTGGAPCVLSGHPVGSRRFHVEFRADEQASAITPMRVFIMAASSVTDFSWSTKLLVATSQVLSLAIFFDAQPWTVASNPFNVFPI